jgi:hypothetical protein
MRRLASLPAVQGNPEQASSFFLEIKPIPPKCANFGLIKEFAD